MEVGLEPRQSGDGVRTPYLQPCFPLTVELSDCLAVQTASAQPARLHLLSSYYVPCAEDKQVKERKCLHFRSLHAAKGDEIVERGIYQVGAQDRSSGKGDASLFTTSQGATSLCVCVSCSCHWPSFLSTNVPISVLEPCWGCHPLL